MGKFKYIKLLFTESVKSSYKGLGGENMPQLLASLLVFLGTLYFLGEPDSAGDLIIEKIAYLKAALVFLLSLFSINLLFITPMRLVCERQEKLDALKNNSNVNSSQDIGGIPKMLLLELGQAETNIKGAFNANVDSCKISSLGNSINDTNISSYIFNFFNCLKKRDLILKNLENNNASPENSIISTNKECDSWWTHNQAYNYYEKESLHWCWVIKQYLLGDVELNPRDGFDFKISGFSYVAGKPIEITWKEDDDT